MLVDLCAERGVALLPRTETSRFDLDAQRKRDANENKTEHQEGKRHEEFMAEARICSCRI